MLPLTHITARVGPLAAFGFAKKDVDRLAFRQPRVGAHGLEHEPECGLKPVLVISSLFWNVSSDVAGGVTCLGDCQEPKAAQPECFPASQRLIWVLCYSVIPLILYPSLLVLLFF